MSDSLFYHDQVSGFADPQHDSVSSCFTCGTMARSSSSIFSSKMLVGELGREKVLKSNGPVSNSSSKSPVCSGGEYSESDDDIEKSGSRA